VKRVALVTVQILAAVLVGLAIRELWLAARGGGTTAAPPSAVSVTTSITPDVVAFGTPVVATADVVANARLIRADTIRLEVDFSPYEPSAKPTVERTTIGDVTHVTFRYPLRCLKEGCEPAAARGIAQFESGFVRYRFRDSPGNGRDIVDWPPVEVASRVAAVDVEKIDWRASRTDLPAVTTRFGPTGLAVALLVAAVVLAAVAVWLARRLWHVAPEPEADEPAARLSPLEQALELVRAQAGNGASPPDRRRALERVARELGALGLHDLADEARALAWSPRVSTAEDVEDLARRAESAVPRLVRA
jgi:hypothetical protein